MDNATWMLALIGGAAIVGAAIAYGILTQRRCNSEMKPTKQDKIDEVSWREELQEE